MLCSLKELDLDTHDFAYGVIKPAALLNNYKPTDPEKPSIPADIKPGDKVFGSVVCAGVKSVAAAGVNLWNCVFDLGGAEKELLVDYQNIHEWELVAYDTKSDRVLGLDDLHAEQKEFPTASTTVSSSSTRRTLRLGTIFCPSSARTTTWSNMRSRPTARTACA